MLNLYVLDAKTGCKVPAYVSPASEEDFAQTYDWQTDWTSRDAVAMPNKVALRRSDDEELLGLMSYAVHQAALMVEIVYIESAGHSNANMVEKDYKKYIGIAKALFAYAADVSIIAGCDGVLVFKAKTSELVDYYIQEFGARHAGAYDPFRLILWEDAAERLLAAYEKEVL